MKETVKTAVFLGAAGALLLVVWLTRPALPTADEKDMRNKLIVEEFDPAAAASLQIDDFDESTSTPRHFEVAETQVKGKTRWSIPSKYNYPADAKDQLAGAATSLMRLKALDVLSSDAGGYEVFGVADPTGSDLKPGMGAGTRVTLKDKEGKVLLSLIVGKEVPDRPGLRYVRRPDEDQVLVAEVETDKLSTKFADWIEKDLLKMSSWDLKQVFVRDHSVDVIQGGVEPRRQITLGYDDTADPKWKMIKDEDFVVDEKTNRPKWVPVKMAGDEELNTGRLDEMRTALDDLKIVDVRAKPAGLSSNLKAAKDFKRDVQSLDSLSRCGFHLANIGAGLELVSNEGEVRYLMKDGVEYVLRFGASTGESGDSSKAKEKEKKDGKDEKKESASKGANRYLFVMAEFNPDALAKPVFEAVPAEKKESPAAKDAVKKPEEKTAPKAEAKTDGKAGEKPAAKKDDAKGPDLKAERERIIKDNKRKQEEYDEKVQKGKDRVKELNARFADWYYVIADDVYRKIHLSRDQIVKKKEKKDEKAKEGKDAAAGDHAGHDHAAEKPDAKPVEKPAAPEKAKPEAPAEKAKSEAPIEKAATNAPAGKPKTEDKTKPGK